MYPSTDFTRGLLLARLLPRSIFVGPRSLRLFRLAVRLAYPSWKPRGGAVERLDPTVSVRVFRPKSPSRRPIPGVLYIHGGGYVSGNAATGDKFCRRAARELGVVAASVEYRLAPEHPYPTPLEDCYAALRWLADQPDVEADRIAIVGDSAGGGLAAALAILATERGDVRPVLQMLSYPMVDDRTVRRTDIDGSRIRLWNQRSNRFGWRSYLRGIDSAEMAHGAVPARWDDLSDLPPAWIGVGTNDLFHDEDLAYAERLRAAGVSCTVHVVPGAYHGFDAFEPRAAVSREFLQARLSVLDKYLNGDKLSAAAS
ncbi:alpha/beta hydrolase [Nocardia sp. NPDC052278]|uniref:alpha/beta hydrolase n=1 Tax=unclassified Nocardia TaxID=2637762 RepID=UPI0036C2847E